MGEGVKDVPVVVVFFRERAGGCEAFVEAVLEALDFVDVVGDIVAGAELLVQRVVCSRRITKRTA